MEKLSTTATLGSLNSAIIQLEDNHAARSASEIRVTVYEDGSLTFEVASPPIVVNR